MLDSSVLIDAERGRIDLRARLEVVSADPVVISAITASELMHGVHRATTPRTKKAREAFVARVLEEVPLAEFGLEEARTHARIWAELVVRGGMVGAHDLLIAATALTLGFRVATSNLRDFGRIPELQVEDWSVAR